MNDGKTEAGEDEVPARGGDESLYEAAAGGEDHGKGNCG